MPDRDRASLSPWDPFRSLDWGGLDWERDFFRSMPRLRGFAGTAPARWSPALDICEDESHYRITVELAGARREDVNVEVHDGVLSIRGEKRSEREDKDEHHRVVERQYGAFSRAFTLPSNAEADKITAGFDNGVLTVEIPKAEPARPRPISVR